MKYTISERTVTIETTKQGEKLTGEVIQAVTGRKVTWDDVKAEALALTHQQTPVDETPDPLEDVNYTDVDPSVIASEELAYMVPANILPAE